MTCYRSLKTHLRSIYLSLKVAPKMSILIASTKCVERKSINFKLKLLRSCV